MTAGRKVNAHAHARAQQTQSARTQTWSKGPIYCLRALSKLAMAARAYDYLLVSMCDVRYVYSMQRLRAADIRENAMPNAHSVHR